MQKLRVAVVGLGALGSEAVRYLGLLGAGVIVAIDFDSVESGNLLYSTLLGGPGNISKLKSTVISDAIHRYFPLTESELFCYEIADVGFGVLSGVDLVLSCVDSDWARLDIAYIARELSLPVCDAGLGAPDYRHGRVTFFPEEAASACYGCILSPSRRRELLLERDYSRGSCSMPVETSRDGQILPGTPMMASMVAGLQVDCGLRELSRAEKTAYTIDLELTSPRIERIAHPRAISCPFHEPSPARLLASREQCARDLLRSCRPGKAVLLDWPICTECRCDVCAHRWRPMQRTAVVRRHGACPACESARITMSETIGMIDPDSPWAGTPFSALGLPDHHLYALVEAGA